MQSVAAEQQKSVTNKGLYMSLAREIAPHLPLLRRYARALTGAQASGDAFVAASLEAIVANPDEFPTDLEPRAGLYKVFHRIWESANIEIGGEEDNPSARKAQERLKQLAPLTRQVLLLTTLENFTPQETSEILGRNGDEVNALLDEAIEELDKQTKARVLIIEDEAVIAMDLSDLITAAGHDVCAMETTASGAVAAAKRERPDLVLADIQLADNSSGIDAVKEILASFSVPVIFITAFPARLLTGERPARGGAALLRWSCFMRKFTSPLIALALLGASVVSACNTVEGVGEDVQAAGQAVEQAAEETNDGNPNTP